VTEKTCPECNVTYEIRAGFHYNGKTSAGNWLYKPICRRCISEQQKRLRKRRKKNEKRDRLDITIIPARVQVKGVQCGKCQHLKACMLIKRGPVLCEATLRLPDGEEI
jgi:hypothetical protein